MRSKITIAFGLLLIALLALLFRSATSPPQVSFTFRGYSDEECTALFVLTNHLTTYSRYVIHSLPQIQYQTTGGWTNYSDAQVMDYSNPLPGCRDKTVSAALPIGHYRWRAALRYRVLPAPWWGRWRRRIEPLLNSIHVGNATNEFTILTGEFVR